MGNVTDHGTRVNCRPTHEMPLRPLGQQLVALPMGLLGDSLPWGWLRVALPAGLILLPWKSLLYLGLFQVLHLALT